MTVLFFPILGHLCSSLSLRPIQGLSGLQISPSAFPSLLKTNVRSSSLVKCGIQFTSPLYCTEFPFLKVANCQFANIVSPPNAAILGYYYLAGSVTISACLFWSCIAQGNGSVIDLYPRFLNLDQICFDGSYSVSRSPAAQVNSGPSGRLAFESISIKDSSNMAAAGSRSFMELLSGDQFINNFNCSSSSMSSGSFGPFISDASESSFKFFEYRVICALSILRAVLTENSNTFLSFNFVNCSRASAHGALLSLSKVPKVEIRDWAFSMVDFQIISSSKSGPVAIVSNCAFWFAENRRQNYFVNVQVEFQNAHFGEKKSSLNPFVIRIGDTECRSMECRMSFWPEGEALAHAVLVMIATALIAVVWYFGLILPPKIVSEPSALFMVERRNAYG